MSTSALTPGATRSTKPAGWPQLVLLVVIVMAIAAIVVQIPRIANRAPADVVRSAPHLTSSPRRS